MEILYFWLSYALLALFAGAMAGLLGIGGGLVVVPILAGLFASQGFAPQHLMQLAVGTSLATLAFTSLSSMWAHRRHAAVDWPVMRQLSVGIVLGGWLGAVLAGRSCCDRGSGRIQRRVRARSLIPARFSPRSGCAAHALRETRYQH